MSKKTNIKSQNDINKAANAIADLFNDGEFIRGTNTARKIKNAIKDKIGKVFKK